MDDLLQTQIKEICRLNMPEGLKELMSDISREVLQAQPSDICGFIANYLSALLVTRDNLSIASQICTHVCECDCRPELIRVLKDIGLSDTDAEIAQNVILKYFTKKKVNEGNLLAALLRQTAIDDTMFPAITEAVRAAYLSHQAHEYTKYELSSETDQDDVAAAAAHTLNIYRETRPAQEAYGEMAGKIQTSYRAYGVQRNFTPKPDHLRIDQFRITSPGSSFSEDVKKEDRKLNYARSVAHPFVGDYVRLRASAAWRRGLGAASDRYVVFADVVGKVARSTGRVARCLCVVSTGALLLLEAHSLRLKRRVPAHAVWRLSLSPHADDLLVVHVRACVVDADELSQCSSRDAADAPGCLFGMEITTSMNNKRMNTVSSFSLAGSLYDLPKHAPYNAHDDDSLSELEKNSEKEHAHIDYTTRSPRMSVVSEKRTIIPGAKKRISFQNDSEEEIYCIKKQVDKHKDSIDEKVEIDEDKFPMEAEDDIDVKSIQDGESVEEESEYSEESDSEEKDEVEDKNVFNYVHDMNEDYAEDHAINTHSRDDGALPKK